MWPHWAHIHAEVIKRMLSIGSSMSNVMFNLGQRDNPDAKQFKELCAKWDAAAHDALDLRAALKNQSAPAEAAQGEDSALVVAPTAAEIYLVGAYEQYEGTSTVRAFAQEADAIAFAAACNAYEATRQRDGNNLANNREWTEGHPSKAGIGCDSFEVESVPFGPPIPAIVGTKEDES